MRPVTYGVIMFNLGIVAGITVAVADWTTIIPVALVVSAVGALLVTQVNNE